MHKYLIFFLFLISQKSMAQFAPQAGLVGSTALHKSHASFIAWADSCAINRGWQNILDTTLGKTTVGDYTSATQADNNVISLGDGGEAIYYFQNPIVNNAGADFAIFENGFYNLSDSNLAFLELAFVDVSEDGQKYYRFPVISNTDTLIQVPGFGSTMDARKINNLAGKYVGNWGTPFDLQELASNNIDLNNIHYIKITDVVGSLQNGICSYDNAGNKINDPFTTPFASSGFDLDALGIIHQKYPTNIIDIFATAEISIYPNPCTTYVSFDNLPSNTTTKCSIYNMTGKCLMMCNITNKQVINTSSFTNGLYILSITTENTKQKIIITKL